MAKRKRNLDMRCVLFPDDLKDTFRKAGKPSARTSTPATKSWERCGDSFLDTSVVQKLQTSEKKSRNAHNVALASVSGKRDAGTDEPVHIAWSSSEEEEGDHDSHPPSRLTVTQAPHRPRAHKQHPVDYHRSLRMFSTGVETDDLPSIDSDSELEDDPASKEHSDFLNPVLSPAEISAYSSYVDSDVDPEESRADSFLVDPAETSKQSVSEWVRSAQAILRTPQKQIAKSAKTPEDSSKKRRFERGGLAERLNRLHSRQRSAISFWRHQCNSTTSAADRPGVLTLRILGVREECGMQATVCDRLPEGERCVALFNKATSAQLQPVPGDIVHIYPPWQNLVVEGERYPIILNTHFSQKICVDNKQDNAGGPRDAVAVEKCRPPPLTRCLWRSGTSQVSTQKYIPCKQVGEFNRSDIRKSLLDAVEDCGSLGSQSGPVEVVVQRVYCIPITQSLHRASLQHRALSKPAEPVQPQHIGRLCALVQDSYGMFGEVFLQCVSTESEIQLNSEHLEGCVCLLQALRVVQRLTRDKCSLLFSMIDSLWPPPVDPKSHDGLPQSPSDRVPPPSFCYRLSIQQGHMVPLSRQAESPLYRPPVLQTLREILQSSNAGEMEMLLIVTDPSLQTEPNTEGNRRTVAVCLSLSCLIRSSVTQALDALQQQPVLKFRDAVKEHGQIFCWDQTVIQLEPEDPSFSIPQPIILDHLGPETLQYSLCSVTGVIVAVDESTAFSWPTCSRCESCHLETREKQKGFLCLACGAVMDEATIKMQLEVFLSCSSLSHCTVKVQLQQKTINSLLDSTRCPEGYSVENVLGSEIGPLGTFVHVVNRSHTVWMGLEELSFDLR
ncbi:DNA repair-scaffolding protein isoform X2 [Siphateles boraxobius]|uniref:DNA repair-scaffolding protein isoform X2 n=1 Tax=Siphateles boraxobius TaxID=180520 RepID=UPI004064C525